MTILAIDDEAPIREWLQFCIDQMEDFNCITAANAEEGFGLFQSQHPEIIITDIEMPGENGLQMLEKIEQTDPSVYAIVLTSHEDFDYARSAIKLRTAEYILKTEMTKESLSGLLANARAKLNNRNDTFSHSLVAREHFLQAIALHKNPEPVSFAFLRDNGISFSRSSILALEYLGICEETVCGKISEMLGLFNVYTFTLNASYKIEVGNIPEETGEISDEAIAGIAASSGITKETYLGISDIFQTPEQIQEAIDQAHYRCNMCFYTDEKNIFRKENPVDIAHEEDKFQVEYLKSLLNQNFSAAFTQLKSFIGTAEKCRPAEIDEFKKVIASAAVSFLYFSRDSYDDIDHLSDQVKEKIVKADRIGKISQLIDDTLGNIIRGKDADVKFTPEVRKAIEYLHQNYAMKNSLSEISHLVGFSTEYFSRIFSKETGINYVTYLNNLRMKRAVELLENSSLKVYEIAEQVGFSSLSYFSTTFKKKFGSNPYEYQMKKRTLRTGEPEK